MRPAGPPPRDCPVCADRLRITQLGCRTCGTGLTGDFVGCEFCGLDEADRTMLRLFLTSRGNLKDLERHLGVSYPTARARFDDLLRKLGIFAPAAGAAEPGEPPAPGRTESTGPTGSPGIPDAGPTAASPDRDARLATLRAVARGELDVEAARRRLTG